MVSDRGRGSPIHVRSRFEEEHVHGMALNTMEDSEGADAIGFEAARLKLQRFAEGGMKTQIADRFLQMLSGECIGGVDRANGVVREANASDASHAAVLQTPFQTT